MRIAKTNRGGAIFRGRLSWGWALAALILNLVLALPGWGGTISSTWNGTSGNWSAGADWTPTGAPNNGGGNIYDVAIGGSTVTLDISPTIQTLALSGGVLTGTAQTLTLDDLWTWSGGTAGATASTEIIDATAGISFSNDVTFAGGTIDNAATATWSGTGYIYALGADVAGENTTFNNQAGANFDVQSNQTYYGFSSTSTAPDVFNNAGTFTKSVTTGGTTIDAEFNNSNTVNVQTGTLLLNGGGTESGSFAISSGAALTLQGTYTFQNTSSLSGLGNVDIASGTTTFNPGATISPATLTLNGTLVGSGAIAVTGTFDWSGGTVGAGGSTETLSPSGGMTISNQVTFAGGTIDNTATATWTNTGYIYAYGLDASGKSTTFNNQSGANFDVQGDQIYYGFASTAPFPDVFNNAGTLTKSVTTGTTTFDTEFNNSNAVNVQTGTLLLNGGGTESGSFDISSGATLTLQGTYTFQSTSTLTDLGNVNIAFGTTTFNPGATISPATLTLSGSGTMVGSGAINVTNAFDWTGGTLGAGGSTETLNPVGGMSVNGTVTFAGGTIDNTATTTWTNAGYIYAYGLDASGKTTTFNNQLGANFNVQGNQLYYGFASTAPFPDVFNNLGTFTKSVGTGTTTFDAEFNNSNTVNVQTGTLLLNGGGTESGSFALSSSTALTLSGVYTFQNTSSLSGLGNVNISFGTTTFNPGATISPATLTVNGSGTLLGSGAIAVTGALDWTAGTIGAAGSPGIISPNGGMSIIGEVTFAGGAIDNTATTTWSGAGGEIYAVGQDASGKTTTFNNQSGANFNVQSDEIYYGNGAASPFPDVFNNAGTLTKSVTTGTTTFNAEFNNTNVVNANTGTLAFSGGVIGNGTINVAVGAAVTATSFNQGTLANNGTTTISGAGTVGHINGTGTLHLTNTSALQLALGGTPSSQGTVTIDTGGKLDITDNTLVVSDGGNRNAATTAYGAYIATGYASGAWTGTGINSSKVASVNAAHGNEHLYGIGYADAGDAAVALDHFTAGTLVIKPAIVGDANLDGVVNYTDFQLFSANFNGVGTSWDQGNFNYGEGTTYTDFQLLSGNFNDSTSLDSAEFDSMNAIALSHGQELVANADGDGFSFVTVPEPATVGILSVASFGLLVRRKRCAR